MEDIGKLRLQILDEFRNMKSSFLNEVKKFKNEFLQSCVKHSPREQVNKNSTNGTLERFINQLEQQISFLREQLGNKDKSINSLINQPSKNIEVIQTPVINPQDKNKRTKENVTLVKQKLSHNTETTNKTDLNTSVIKTPYLDFTVEKSNEIEKHLSDNTDKKIQNQKTNN